MYKAIDCTGYNYDSMIVYTDPWLTQPILIYMTIPHYFIQKGHNITCYTLELCFLDARQFLSAFLVIRELLFREPVGSAQL